MCSTTLLLISQSASSFAIDLEVKKGGKYKMINLQYLNLRSSLAQHILQVDICSCREGTKTF